MNIDESSPYRVYVIVAPSYGERLAALPPAAPVWIVKSAFNTPVAQRLWSERPATDFHTGITIFGAGSAGTPEEDLLSTLEDVDLHHGAYSVLEVVGCEATPHIRAALHALGFDEITSRSGSFTAFR